MSDRTSLTDELEAHYRSNGWKVKRDDEEILYATGPGGVTWIGAALTSTELESEDIEDRIREMAAQRMQTGGELCPLDLLPDPECEPRVRELLDRLGLGDRPHVSVYSRAA